MSKMAALAQSAQVTKLAVPGVVIEMGRGQTYGPAARLNCFDQIGPSRRASPRRAPCSRGRVKPAAVGQAFDLLAMRALAVLTSSTGALEADAPADIAPVGRIKTAQFRAYWHNVSLAECACDVQLYPT